MLGVSVILFSIGALLFYVGRVIECTLFFATGGVILVASILSVVVYGMIS